MASIVNQYGTATNSGAATRANLAAATFTVPTGRRLMVTEVYFMTDDATGGFVYLTTGAGGLVAANDVFAAGVLVAAPTLHWKFANPIQFAAGTVVTLDAEQTASGAGVVTHAGWNGYIQNA